MCGISAICGVDLPVAEPAVHRMVTSLDHRGPDGSGVHCLDGCVLGHNRLSIIDLESGQQPMSDVSGRYWIAFNGEIYNYAEIRHELGQRGVRFHTASDTEVIIAAYAEYGAACLGRFRGMFAFALWDSVERRLFCARDPFGEKPLYFATNDGALVLASEVKAILASGVVPPRLSLESVDAYLAFGYVPPDRTIYSNVATLPPGHYLEWTASGPTVTAFWRPRLDSQPVGIDEAGDKLRRLLTQAVRRQMVADVPVGAFLSGGLDSSTIVALMKSHSERPVKTFSVGFGSQINELPYARAVSDLYQTEHHEIDLGTPKVAELLERMAGVYDEPFADSSHIPTYLISEFARRSVKVVLTGDGGDEMFGGYGWYQSLLLAEQASRSKARWLLLTAVGRMLGARGARLALRANAAGLAARWPNAWRRCIMSQVHSRADRRRTLWGARAGEVMSYEPGEYYRPADTAGLNAAFFFDLTSYLPGDILVKVDRASMAHGLETRAPFLDPDVAAFALSLPVSLKVSSAELKIIMKAALSRYWPEALRGRAKHGFGAPYSSWMARPDVQALTRRTFADGSPLRTLLPGIGSAQETDRTYLTWQLLTLGLWLERWQVRL